MRVNVPAENGQLKILLEASSLGESETAKAFVEWYSGASSGLRSDTAGMVVEPVKPCRASMAPVAFAVLWLRLV